MLQVLNRKLDNTLLILTFALANANIFIVNKLNISYVHYFLMVFYCVLFFPHLPSLKNKINAKHIFYVKLYFASVFFIIVVNLVFYDNPVSFIFNSLTNSVLTPLFILIILSRNSVNWSHLYYLLIVFALIASFLGIYQFFYDRSLFGIYDFSDFYTTELLFRTRGNLSSPQVYGLFLAISSIICFEVLKIENKKKILIFGLFIVFAAFLSGNKSVVFLVVTYLLFSFWHFFENSKNVRSNIVKGLIVSAFFLGTLVVVNPSFLKIGPSLTLIADRINVFSVVDDSKIIQAEQRGRFRVYDSHWEGITINPLSIIIGDGIGSYSSMSRVADDERVASESYFLQIFLEFGFLPILFLFIILMNSLKTHFRNKSWVNYYILLAIIISSFIVHAFVYPVFFILWLPILMLKK